MPSQHVERFATRLAALCVASLLTGMSISSKASESSELFDGLVASAAAAIENASNDATSEVQREADRATALINGITSSIWCLDAPAEAYLGGFVGGVLQQRLEFDLHTPEGSWYFDLKTGLTLAEVIESIVDAPYFLGIQAAVAPDNTDRIYIRFYTYGAVPFVRVRQFESAPAAVYSGPLGGTAMFDWTDYRCAVGVPTCAEPGVLYVSSPGEMNQGHTTLIVAGSEQNSQMFTFMSGTSVEDIASALNTFSDGIGIFAETCERNPQRIKVRSTTVGATSRVWIQEVGGVPPIIYTQPVGGVPSYNTSDFGRDRVSGDVDCDRAVGMPDLMQAVNTWGACPPTPTTCPADLDANEVVNVADLLTVIANWGQNG